VSWPLIRHRSSKSIAGFRARLYFVQTIQYRRKWSNYLGGAAIASHQFARHWIFFKLEHHGSRSAVQAHQGSCDKERDQTENGQAVGVAKSIFGDKYAAHKV